MITAEALTFGYVPDKPILAEWSAEFPDGCVTAVTGPSGSGKSTLMYLLGLFLRPVSGRILINGAEVTRMRDTGRSDVRAEKIGFVFQDALLDPRRTILDNVLEGSVYRGERRANIMPRARKLLETFGVGVELDRKAVNLSGGQAQRVSLCRAMLADPPILLADEPTGNIDEDNARTAEDVLFDLAAAGRCVVVVTHDRGLAERCDRQLEL